MPFLIKHVLQETLIVLLVLGGGPLLINEPLFYLTAAINSFVVALLGFGVHMNFLTQRFRRKHPFNRVTEEERRQAAEAFMRAHPWHTACIFGGVLAGLSNTLLFLYNAVRMPLPF